MTLRNEVFATNVSVAKPLGMEDGAAAVAYSSTMLNGRESSASEVPAMMTINLTWLSFTLRPWRRSFQVNVNCLVEWVVNYVSLF